MQKAATPQLEYKVESGHLNEKKLNEIASQGWELVAIDPAGQYTPAPSFIFKRGKGCSHFRLALLTFSWRGETPLPVRLASRILKQERG